MTATVRANARTLPEDLNRRGVLGSVLAAGALVATPFPVAAANLGVEPELRALIDAWHEGGRRLEEAADAYWAAEERARCSVPQALIATDRDASFWSDCVPGRQYQESDVTRFRCSMVLSARVPFDEIFSCSGYDDRIAEIVASWDDWQAERKAAKEREGVAAAKDLWNQAVENYHATGHRVAKLPAKTMADVIAKLLAATSQVLEDDLEDPEGHAAILAGAALDAKALLNPQRGEARS
jgi:hypothetical protein